MASAGNTQSIKRIIDATESTGTNGYVLSKVSQGLEWVVGGGGSSGTLQQVCTNGNTTNTSINMTGKINIETDSNANPIAIGNSKNWYVRLTLEIVSTTYSNPSALTNLEDDIETILALIPTNWVILSVSSPRIRQTNSTDLLSAEIQLQTAYTG